MPTNTTDRPERRSVKRVVMHHPQLRKQARFRPAEQHIWRRKGWKDGPLPERTDTDPESKSDPEGEADQADTAPARGGRRNTSGKAAEGK